MTDLDLSKLDEITSPKKLDNHILKISKEEINKKLSKKHIMQLTLSFVLGLLSVLPIYIENYKKLTIDNITASDINLNSLKLITRSNDYSNNINIDNLTDKQLKKIAYELLKKDQLNELNKLTIYMQKRKYEKRKLLDNKP